MAWSDQIPDDVIEAMRHAAAMADYGTPGIIAALAAAEAKRWKLIPIDGWPATVNAYGQRVYGAPSAHNTRPNTAASPEHDPT